MKNFLLLAAEIGASAVFGIAGGFVGFILGLVYGGNFATHFEFAATRGYEATGIIGTVLGTALSAPYGILLVRKMCGGGLPWAAWLGSSLGGAVSLGLLHLQPHSRSHFLLVLPILGGLVACRSSAALKGLLVKVKT